LISPRRCKNWLDTLLTYVEETESPRDFWLWSGISTIGAALQRRVWVPFGLENIYPNLYMMFVAEPGWCRKGAPVGLSKKMLLEVGVDVSIDSPTKRYLTKKLDELSRGQHFQHDGVAMPQAAMACISKELSSFLANDPKAMTEALTDLYDSHDVWDYGTSGAGEDVLRSLCISCLMATTPSWIARNLPEEAIGGGFTSRFVLISGQERHKDVPYPPPPPRQLYQDLVGDLGRIYQITGEAVWEQDARDHYDNWYLGIRQWAHDVGDSRLFASFSRVHVMAIKAAICYRVSYSDELILTKKDIEQAIKMLTIVFNSASAAFSSHGRSKTAIETDNVYGIIDAYNQISFKKLLRANYRNTDRAELRDVLDNLEAMGKIDWVRDPVKWISLISIRRGSG